MKMKAYTVRDYIKEKFKNSQVLFAKRQGVKNPQLITQWISNGYIVLDHGDGEISLYSKRRSLIEV